MWDLETKALMFTIYAILFLCNLCDACDDLEYNIGEKCCAMCRPGTRVSEHCSEGSSTVCVPCASGTFIDEYNHLAKCLACAVCDPGLGLKTEKACNSTSDTLCGPLDQHFCIDQNKGCRKAERHTNCEPGQFIQKNGTASSDTKCGECPHNTFSDGLSDCRPHRDCTIEGLEEIKPGNRSSDSECGEKSVNGFPVWIFALIGIFLVFIVGATVFLTVWKARPELMKGQQSCEMKSLQGTAPPAVDSTEGNLPLTGYRNTSP